MRDLRRDALIVRGERAGGRRVGRRRRPRAVRRRLRDPDRPDAGRRADRKHAGEAAPHDPAGAARRPPGPGSPRQPGGLLRATPGHGDARRRRGRSCAPAATPPGSWTASTRTAPRAGRSPTRCASTRAPRISRTQRGAALDNRGGGRRVGPGVPRVVLGGAAEDQPERLREEDDVPAASPGRRHQPLLDPRVLDHHELPAHREDRRVGHQRTGAEPRAVDDDGRLRGRLLQRFDGPPLHAPPAARSRSSKYRRCAGMSINGSRARNAWTHPAATRRGAASRSSGSSSVQLPSPASSVSVISPAATRTPVAAGSRASSTYSRNDRRDHGPTRAAGSIRYGQNRAPATADVVRAAGSRDHTRTRRPRSASTTAVVSPTTPPPTTITVSSMPGP